MSELETSFVMIKPDGVQRGLTGAVLGRLERRGFRVVAMRMLYAPKETVISHYAEHRDKNFFDDLVDFLAGEAVVILGVEGAQAVAAIRKMAGATEPFSALPGTIRGDFCHMTYGRASEKPGRVIANIIHASDSPESAERELALWFSEQELCRAGNRRCDAGFH